MFLRRLLLISNDFSSFLIVKVKVLAMKNKILMIILAVAIASSLVFYVGFQNYILSQNPEGYNGITTVKIAKAETELNPPPNAYVCPKNNSIIFTSSNVNLIVLTMGHIRAENLTGRTPPAYAQHNVFVIYGLINPTLIIPEGAIIHVTVINLDAGDCHNFVITTISPPYSYNVMMGGNMMNNMMMNKNRYFISMMPLLPHANYSAGEAYEYSYTTSISSPGTYWYVCTYPGHAEMGMYGKILVVS